MHNVIFPTYHILLNTNWQWCAKGVKNSPIHCWNGQYWLHATTERIAHGCNYFRTFQDPVRMMKSSKNVLGGWRIFHELKLVFKYRGNGGTQNKIFTHCEILDKNSWQITMQSKICRWGSLPKNLKVYLFQLIWILSKTNIF